MSTYTDENTNGYKIRTFDKDVPDNELIWHRDQNDRMVEVVNGYVWKFQFDNELPLDLKPGDILYIKKDRIHRVIKGYSDLTLKIKEF